MIIALSFAIVLSIAFIIGIVVVAPIVGWKLALNYLYERYCEYGYDPDADPLAAWDSALSEATDVGPGRVWRQMFSPDMHAVEVEDYFEARGA